MAATASSTSEVTRIGSALGYDDAASCAAAVDGSVWFAENYIYPNGWRPGKLGSQRGGNLRGGAPFNSGSNSGGSGAALLPLPNPRFWYEDFFAAATRTVVPVAIAAVVVSYVMRFAVAFLF